MSAAVSRTQSDAAADKALAVEQLKAQLPSGADQTISTGFERLGRTRAWLADLRRSVGYFECRTNGVAYRGAAEILDPFGTLVLCGHEFVHGPRDSTELDVIFYPTAAQAIRLPVSMRYVDREHDIAFAVVQAPDPAAALQTQALRPVLWAPDVPTKGEVIFVGFPEGIARLHATKGAVRAMRPVNTANGDGSLETHGCKMETAGVTFSGMSGGGVFRDGAFVGLINFSTPAGASPFTYYTPASAIAFAYRQLFPDRAARAGAGARGAASAGDLPADCGFARGGFQTIVYP